MYLQIVPALILLILSILLVAYTIRSLIFLIVSRNIIKSVYDRSTQYASKAAADNNFDSRIDHITSLSNKIRSISYHDIVTADVETEKYSQINKKYIKVNEAFVSILIASYNESQVIGRLMKSCAALTYNQNKFEIIVVDDSDDETLQILDIWEKKIPNLKIIHRIDRRGWKGGALNVALKNMSTKSSYVLIVDADNIIVSHTLESFVSCFKESYLRANIVDVVQGYPVPGVYNSKDKFDNNYTYSIRRCNSNWIAKAIDFRLAKRNLIEFVAKDKLNLPLQVIGSLFMIRTEVIKSIRFSEDLAEDWNLTLNIHLSPNNVLTHVDHYSHENKQQNKPAIIIGSTKVIYKPSIISYTETTTKFKAYFRQRMRVSEGHTRGFIKNIFRILTSKKTTIDKVEFIFTGLQYAKFIVVLTLIVIDSILLVSNGISFAINNNFMKSSLLVQAAILSINIGISFVATDVCKIVRNYSIKDVLYLLFLNLCTMPAFAIGSLLGLFRKEGTFYRTERNNID
jgi:cellulose synthase/poly-beta-1,6-N-acetylglucosamine synthase-like glycosyltransferase